MQEESTDKLDRLHGHRFLGVVVGRVPPAESDLAFLHLDQTSVGDSDAMSVACQIPQDVLGTAERGADFDHPLQFLETA